MKIRVYASLSPEHLISKGKEAGLSEEATEYFRYFNEVAIDLHVDAENGAVCGATIAQTF